MIMRREMKEKYEDKNKINPDGTEKIRNENHLHLHIEQKLAHINVKAKRMRWKRQECVLGEALEQAQSIHATPGAI